MEIELILLLSENLIFTNVVKKKLPSQCSCGSFPMKHLTLDHLGNNLEKSESFLSTNAETVKHFNLL